MHLSKYVTVNIKFRNAIGFQISAQIEMRTCCWRVEFTSPFGEGSRALQSNETSKRCESGITPCGASFQSRRQLFEPNHRDSRKR